MALPPAIQKCVVSFGPFLTFTGVPFAGKVRFTASRPAVWTATGTPLLPSPEVVVLDENGMGQITLPVTSQDGFSDGQGNSVKDWTYRADIDLQGRSTDFRTFQIPTTAAMDLDLTTPVPSSQGVVVALPSVVSVDGGTGAVDLSSTYARRILSFDDLPATGLVVPHRFGMKQWPENARTGAALSIAAGYPVQETDVYLSADGVLVCGHDATVDRETNGTGAWADYPVAGMPLRDSLDSGGAPSLGDGWAPEEVLRFDELLAMAAGNCLLNVEPKASGPWQDSLAELYRICVGAGAMDRVCINGSDIAIQEAAIALGFRTIYWGHDTNQAELQYAASVGVWGYDVSDTRTDAEIAFIRGLFDYVIMSPVETRALWARANALGLNGVCTDHPGYVSRTTPLVTSTKSATSRGRLIPGNKPARAAGFPHLVAGKGMMLGFYGGTSNRFFLGELSGTRPSSYRITVTGKVETLITIGEVTRQAASIRFGMRNEDLWNGGDNVGGYQAFLRWNGSLELAVSSDPVGSAPVVQTNATAALTAGGTFTFTATVTPTTVQVGRTDTATVGAPVANTTWRGDYLWLGCNSPNGLVSISEVKVETL